MFIIDALLNSAGEFCMKYTSDYIWSIASLSVIDSYQYVN